MKAVEKWAAAEFRSVNGQLEWMIHKVLKDQKRLKVKKAEPPLEDPKDEKKQLGDT